MYTLARQASMRMQLYRARQGRVGKSREGQGRVGRAGQGRAGWDESHPSNVCRLESAMAPCCTPTVYMQQLYHPCCGPVVQAAVAVAHVHGMPMSIASQDELHAV